LTLLLILNFLAHLPVSGEDATNAPVRDPIQSLLDAGTTFQKQAEQAKTPTQMFEKYQMAIARFSRASELAADSYRAHFLWGHALYGLAVHVTDRDQRRTLVLQTREQYLAAARCSGVESPLYHDWGVMLTQEAELLAANPTERRAILQEAITSLNAGLNLASFSDERARIERDLGAALALLGVASRGLPRQGVLYKQAVEKFESATKVGNEAKTARIFGLWGVALLELGKADNDRMLIRQAVERLQAAIELDTASVEPRYNLARAYALLDQPEPGMRHLKICLDHDPDRAYYNAAVKDPDLDNLRRTPEYNQIFTDESSSDPQTIIRSQISDH
jgi:uncharacterized protein (DUF2249 family)